MILNTDKHTAFNQNTFKLTPLACALICIGTSSTVLAQEAATANESSGIEVIQITSIKRVTSL